MSDVYDSAYWSDEFQVTQADLERIAAHIRETGQAHDLTELAKRVVRGRLRYGPETSAPAQSSWASDPSVRLWDPAGEWKEGDHVIVRTWSYKTRQNTVTVGEVSKVEADGVLVHVMMDDIRDPIRKFERAAAGSPEAVTWHQTVRRALEAMQHSSNLEDSVQRIILKHGQRVVSQLLDALRADDRFVRLAGRWFLHELALSPTEEQLSALAWAMVPLEEPQPTDALVRLVRPPLPEGDPGLFGLYLVMRQHPEMFNNVDPELRPRWVLAGPPAGAFTPRHAAYDPHTYEILCLPNQPASPEIVRRLWDLELLRAVM